VLFVVSGYRFELIVGCMSAGKSSELIRRIERARLANLPAITFRPATDTRSKPDLVQSRNGLITKAIQIGRPQDMIKYSSQAVVFGIDECQFFQEDLVDVLLTLLRQNKKLIAAALDLDYRGRPFGPVPHLLALADRVDKLLAVCRKCGSDFACRTQRLVQSDAQILVGDDQYEARCLSCFEPPDDRQLQIALEGAARAPAEPSRLVPETPAPNQAPVLIKPSAYASGGKAY
jgi:thymidine kinase